MQKGPVPTPHVMGKNLGGISPKQGIPAPHQAPQPRVPCQEGKSHNLWLQKPAGIGSVEETARASVTLKEPTHGLTLSDSLPLGSIPG